ncbi:PLP-dependent aminotransferase family protein [Nonomuraea sp. NPDC000554]|uniref:MocR-like pyridoxine biosynthesis transcription factor PdxR n=1 Tax=Nonomuraea sp. NPDC000554 TaxID=3154259 RepID=UPI003320DBC8
MGRTKTPPDDRSILSGSDFLQLNIDDAPVRGRAGWLAAQLRLAISDGRLPVGSKLPATRTLAADLRVSRGVVTEAYQRLTEDGLIAGRGRAGTTVVAAPVTARHPSRPATPPGPARPFPTDASLPAAPPPAPEAPFLDMPSAQAGRSAAQPSGAAGLFADPGGDVFDALREAPARIDLSPGVPDLAAFPRAAWLRAERAVLGRLVPADFGYGDPRGTPALRLAVAHWLARYRGISAAPEEIVIVAGVAQALGLLAQVLRQDGITQVAVEDPGSLGARQHLRSWQLDTPPVPVDSRGVRVDELRALGVQAVMLTPAHQFPTGVVLDGDRRRGLVRWADEGGLIIEDDYDAEHRYDRPPVPALRSLLAERVCYAGSVSKLLAPALRVGWLLAPERYRDALVSAKRNADLGNAALPQLVLAELMESGALERQLRFLRRRHVRRRDAMIAAIGTHLPGAVVHGAAAGLHLVITFAADFADADLAAAALLRGVKVQPLSWHRQRPGPPGLVLGYAANAPSDIEQGVATLATALRSLT